MSQGPASTSTISVATQKSEETSKKKYACVWPGCGKSFSRSEHLHRHALNHKEGENTCLRCAAHFRRRDLLDRHMMRHKEKDDEAGGEGLGHLATRKRLWRDIDGNIVNARRPHVQEGAKRRQLSSEGESLDSVDHGQENFLDGRSGPFLSPPMSIPTIGLANGDHLEGIQFGSQNWADPGLQATQSDNYGEASDFLCNASWGDQPLDSMPDPGGILPFDDIFKPDTAMSFNAPFTTLSYYSWLFENDGRNLSNGILLPAPSQMETSIYGNDFQYNNHTRMQNGIDSSIDPHTLANPQALNNSHELPSVHPISQGDPRLNDSILRHNRNTFPSSIRSQETGPGVVQSFPPHATSELSDANGASSQSYATSSTAENSDFHSPKRAAQAVQNSYESVQGVSNSAKSPTSPESTPSDQRSLFTSTTHLPDAYTPRHIENLPIITLEARDGMIKIISESHPIKPDESEIDLCHSLLSLLSLQHYSDLFFTRFNSSYPMIHQATFDSSQVHPFLLMAILLLGATYSDKEAHLLAMSVHDIMRPLIHASKEFSTRPKLWMLQVILLVECFGKSRAGEKQHDMSHLYHGLLINLIRKSDCQSAYIPPFNKEEESIEEYWRVSVEAEQKRRLALLCFMWDTQHAVLFSQSLCMNASELKLTLPWDSAVWEATSASEWFALSENAPAPPQYLLVLRMYTNPNAKSPPAHLNALSRVLILHGLMSISWDLNRRNQTSLSLSITNSSIPWQERMSLCYSSWKSDFEKYSATILNALSFSPIQRAKFQRFSFSNLAIYHTAQLLLDVEIIDLQIYAGARHIIGRPVTETDRTRSKLRIGEWTTRNGGESAANATWHAARLFRDGVRKLENWNVDEMFHYPWCLYLATLVCWTFHNAASNRKASVELPPARRPMSFISTSDTTGSSSPSMASTPRRVSRTQVDDHDDEDSDWDSRAEMNALISGLTRLEPSQENFVKEIWEVGAKYKTQGLMRCIVKHLNTVRWAVVTQGMIVLRNLLR